MLDQKLKDDATAEFLRRNPELNPELLEWFDYDLVEQECYTPFIIVRGTYDGDPVTVSPY